MTNSDDIGGPRLVEVTTQFLSETAAKRRAYEERHHMWTAPFHPS
jgi:hypothetical protein